MVRKIGFHPINSSSIPLQTAIYDKINLEGANLSDLPQQLKEKLEIWEQGKCIKSHEPNECEKGNKNYICRDEDMASCTGRLKCPACFRRLSAIAATGFFIPFSNNKLVEKYRSSIDKAKLPFRYESTMNFIKFLDWRDEDGKKQISV